MKKLILVGVLLPSFWVNSVYAGLFDDTEARKKISEIQLQILNQNQVTQNALVDLKNSQLALEKRLSMVEALVQGQGLVDMNNQIEQLKLDVARLQGDLEIATHNIELAQQQQKSLYEDTDARLKKFESGAPSAGSVAPATSTPDANALHMAQELAMVSKHKEAFVAYDQFLRDYPTSSLVPDALYGMGYEQFALKAYKASIATQEKLISQFPTHSKVPDALYNKANSQIQLGQVASAKKTLQDVIVGFPDSGVIPNAQKRLKALEAIK